jgi:hypothetical protein
MSYVDRLHLRAVSAADRILATAAEADPDTVTAVGLGLTAVAEEVSAAADCCEDDYLGFAVMLAAELAVRAAKPEDHR